MKNIKRHLAPLGKFEVRSAQSTIYVRPLEEGVDLDDACERVGKVFGIAAYSRACMAKKDMDDINRTAAEYLKEALEEASTFKVEAKRSDKAFPLKSPAICAETGGYLLERFPNLSVDVHEPDITVTVEIRDFGAYVRGEAERGAGGIPVGTGGKAAVLISGGIDSPVAAWMMAKRGVELTAVHFASPPYTSERAEEKVKELLARVSEYSGRMRLFTVPFTKIQETIQARCPEELFTIIMRRMMMKSLPISGCGRAVPPDYRGKPGAGGEPDDSRHCLHRRGGRPAGIPALDRYGQGGDRPDFPENRGL